MNSAKQKSCDPIVSVIIPTYNRATTVGDAIESVLNQTVDDFEIIVVDDASTDETESVVRGFSDSRIRYLRHKKNKNGSAARNTGIEAAEAELIAFLDSDDRWVPEKLEIQLQRVRDLKSQGKFNKKTVIYSQLDMKTPESRVTIPVRPPRSDQTIRDYIIWADGLVHIITVLMTTAFARSVRFDEQLPVSQDADFAMRLDARGANFSFIEQSLSVWERTGDDHVTGSSDYQAGLDWLDRNPELLTSRQQVRYKAATLSRRALRAGDRHIAFPWIVAGLAAGVLRPREIMELTTAMCLPKSVDDSLWRILRRVYHSFVK